MNFRLSIAAWFLCAVVAITITLLFAAHIHLDEELRADRWDRSHPEFPGWVIHGSYTDEEVHDILGELMHVRAMVGIPMVVVSAGIGYWIAMLSIQPIHKINQQVKQLDWSGARQGIQVPTSDPEIAELVSTLNSLLARLSRSFSEMSEFSAKVAHELRAPLTHLRMRVERDAANLPEEFSEEIQGEIHRLSQLVERALLVAKAEGGRIHPHVACLDLRELIEDLQDYYSAMAEDKGMRLICSLPHEALVLTDPGLLRQVLHNLLGNAVRHGSEQARLRIKTSNDRGSVAIYVSNYKPPAAAADSGVGLGLRLVTNIASALPQTTFRSRDSRGIFSVCLRLPHCHSQTEP